MKLIIDCMGGDNAPAEMLAGAVAARKEFGGEYLLVGDEAALRAEAAAKGYNLTPFEILHADEVVTMEDDAMAWRQKPASSMNLALRALADGQGDAVVSCGNTGALFSGASLVVRRAKGVHRAAIGTVLPFQPPVLLLDAGANVAVQPEFLTQFAIMGTAYMRALYHLESPRVGLLSNGSEETKGTEMHRAAYGLLSACPGIRFVGNVEGNGLTHGVCDVVVTDGFTGNVTLKAFEGMGKMFSARLKGVFKSGLGGALAYLLVKKQIGVLRRDFDSSEIGGSPILGVRKPVIKAHGSSDAKAFKNAIRQAMSLVETGALNEMQEAVNAAAEAAKAAAKEEEGTDRGTGA